MHSGDTPMDDSAANDLVRLAESITGSVLAWTQASHDLNVNLIVLDDGHGIQPHVNDAVDVLILGVAGVGFIEIDGNRIALAPLHAVIVPKGTLRSTGSAGGRFAYLTCHQRRGGLIPGPVRGS